MRCACACISDRKIGQPGTRRSRAAACSAAAQNAARPAVSCGSGGCGRPALRCGARGRWLRQSAAGAAPRHARDTLCAREQLAEVLLRARFLCAGRRGAGDAALDTATTEPGPRKFLWSQVSQAPTQPDAYGAPHALLGAQGEPSSSTFVLVKQWTRGIRALTCRRRALAGNARVVVRLSVANQVGPKKFSFFCLTSCAFAVCFGGC